MILSFKQDPCAPEQRQEQAKARRGLDQDLELLTYT